MKYSSLLNIILAVALVMLTVKIVIDHPKEMKTDNEQAVMDNILTRTSIRQFTDQKLSEEQVEKLLRAGMAAPSACNKQPWRMVVIQDTAQLQAIAESAKPAKPAGQAAAVIVVCGDTTDFFDGEGKDYWIEDCSAVTENILLAAHGMGLGGVWLGVYPIESRVETLKQILNLPDHIIPMAMIAIGYPAENPTPKDKWKPAHVHYNKWNE